MQPVIVTLFLHSQRVSVYIEKTTAHQHEYTQAAGKVAQTDR
jgi:hypothetical protein